MPRAAAARLALGEPALAACPRCTLGAIEDAALGLAPQPCGHAWLGAPQA